MTNDGIEKVFIIDYEKFGNHTMTFHGRDVFAKTAAYVSLGRPLTEFSHETRNFTIQQLQFKKHQVVHIDPYGDIKLSSLPNGFSLGDRL